MCLPPLKTCAKESSPRLIEAIGADHRQGQGIPSSGLKPFLRDSLSLAWAVWLLGRPAAIFSGHIIGPTYSSAAACFSNER